MYKFSAKTEQMLKFGGWHPDTVLDQNFQQHWQEQGFYLGEFAEQFLGSFGGVILWNFIEKNSKLEWKMTKLYRWLHNKGIWSITRGGVFFECDTNFSEMVAVKEKYQQCCAVGRNSVSPIGVFSEYLLFADDTSLFAVLNRNGKLFIAFDWLSVEEMIEQICEDLIEKI